VYAPLHNVEPSPKTFTRSDPTRSPRRAQPSRIAGISRSGAFAVLRLMTNSKCPPGRSHKPSANFDRGRLRATVYVSDQEFSTYPVPGRKPRRSTVGIA
jgi:hypothetical protein